MHSVMTISRSVIEQCDAAKRVVIARMLKDSSNLNVRSLHPDAARLHDRGMLVGKE